MKKELAGWLLIFIYCTALSSPTGQSMFASAHENPKSLGKENELKKVNNSERQDQETYERVQDVLYVHSLQRVKGSGAGETARPKNKNDGGESYLIKLSSASAILWNAVAVLVTFVLFF